MVKSGLTTWGFLIAALSLSAAVLATPPKTIVRDVAIVGGGASGTYAAVRLRNDLNTSIVVIEPKNRLGGHISTYKIPGSGDAIEFGVQSYMRYGPAVDLFSRFGIELGPFVNRRLTTVTVDAATGEPLTEFVPPTNDAVMAALKNWLPFVEKYERLVESGYWEFPAPGKIPKELLEPFTETANKLGIEAAVPRMAAISGFGIGGFRAREAQTWEMVQAFGPAITRDVLQGTLFAPKGSNSLLYEKAYELLKSDVLLESVIQKTERGPQGIRLVVKAKDGSDVVIKAKRVLWTPYPTMTNLKTFDLDKKEDKVMENFVPIGNHVGILHLPCVPENYSLDYISSNAVPKDWLAVRDYPWHLRLDSTGPVNQNLGLFRAMFSTNFTISSEDAKTIINDSIAKVFAADAVNGTACVPEYLAFSNHNGVVWPQGKHAIDRGFVQELYGLQGRRSTWWTGRSFSSGYSATTWAFTETVLQKLIADLK